MTSFQAARGELVPLIDHLATQCKVDQMGKIEKHMWMDIRRGVQRQVQTIFCRENLLKSHSSLDSNSPKIALINLMTTAVETLKP